MCAGQKVGRAEGLLQDPLGSALLQHCLPCRPCDAGMAPGQGPAELSEMRRSAGAEQMAAMPCRCKQAADAPSPNSPFERMAAQSVAIAARRLGLHYLQRYFYLITFVCYLSNSSAREVSFARWMAERRELKHLLSTLTLEPAI